jgi:hypothetical protein
MELQIYLSCWANELDLGEAVLCALDWGYDGVEGPPPMDPGARRELAAEIATRNLPYIAEVATGGNYVPEAGLSVDQHVDDLERHLAGPVADFEPAIVNVLGGSDRWSFSESVDFYARGIELAEQAGQAICWETHRSRPNFNPWVTRDLLLELPGMWLNCDFSHWCAVCERLVMDEESEILDLCAARCRHFHARVGYSQGPQVPDPRDRAYRRDLEAHLRWWRVLQQHAVSRGGPVWTVTPEFGPDGYLHLIPHSNEPVADLRELNRWMCQKLRGEMNPAIG